MKTSDCLLKNNSLSKAQKVLEIFKSNPHLVADVRLCKKLLEKHEEKKVSYKTVSCIVQRLWKKGLIIRTPTQLKTGYLYSSQNSDLLKAEYDDYIMPFDLHNKERLLQELLKSDFVNLSCQNVLNLDLIENFSFVKKYGLNYFAREEVQEFLASNIAFLLCDGHLKKGFVCAEYYFRYKKDALMFKLKFFKCFPKEKLFLEFRQFCYRLYIFNTDFVKLMNFLGVPVGNKLFQPFEVPQWIYHGSLNVKRTFLSTVFGNEGSEPYRKGWRIQFVISKSRDEVSNLLFFVNQLRMMLFQFGISSSFIQLRKGNANRQFSARFYVKGKENMIKFYKELHFAYASEKQKSLELLANEINYINM